MARWLPRAHAVLRARREGHRLDHRRRAAPPLLTTAPVAPALAAALALSFVCHLILWHRLLRRRRALVLVLPALLLPAAMLALLYMRVWPLALARPLLVVAFTYVGFLFFLLPLLVLVPRWYAVAGALVLSGVAMTQALGPVPVRAYFVRAPLELRIAQLSDLHVGPMRGRAFVASIVDSVNRAQPDLVVITGDLVDGTPAQLRDALEPLRGLRAPVYMVLGNHEHLSGAGVWRTFLPTLGIRVLDDERVPLAGFDLVGLDDDDRPHPVARTARYTIVLAHEPHVVRDVHAELQLSGHTHGGQIVPLQLLERLTQGYVAGLYTVGDTTLFVSSGTGFWGPPMRLGSHPEIALLHLGSPSLETSP